uniref:Uncharacterized protein n=1 Tax=Rhipicephalus zambeziensis TaxID=60191 RepID=A0A224YI19_9ACAR
MRYCVRNVANIFTNNPSSFSAAGHALGRVGRLRDRFYFLFFFSSGSSPAALRTCAFSLNSCAWHRLQFRTRHGLYHSGLGLHVCMEQADGPLAFLLSRDSAFHGSVRHLSSRAVAC